MPQQLLEEVAQFLPALEATQHELEGLFAAKLKATSLARADEMLRLAELESSLAQRLTAHVEHRGRILAQAKQNGLPADSLQSLVARCRSDRREELLAKIEAARRRTAFLRTQGWIQWIASHRALCHYAELIELIAQGGKKAPTYGAKNSGGSCGGVILDASI